MNPVKLHAKIVVPLIVTAKDEPGLPPPAIRLRQWLKIGLRRFGIRAAWAAPAPAKKISENAKRE